MVVAYNSPGFVMALLYCYKYIDPGHCLGFFIYMGRTVYMFQSQMNNR